MRNLLNVTSFDLGLDSCCYTSLNDLANAYVCSYFGCDFISHNMYDNGLKDIDNLIKKMKSCGYSLICISCYPSSIACLSFNNHKKNSPGLFVDRENIFVDCNRINSLVSNSFYKLHLMFGGVASIIVNSECSRLFDYEAHNLVKDIVGCVGYVVEIENCIKDLYKKLGFFYCLTIKRNILYGYNFNESGIYKILKIKIDMPDFPFCKLDPNNELDVEKVCLQSENIESFCHRLFRNKCDYEYVVDKCDHESNHIDVNKVHCWVYINDKKYLEIQTSPD